MKNQTLYQKSFSLVFKAIKETFPFSSEEEFLKFVKRYKKYYDGLSKIKNDSEFFIYLKKFLVSLRNSHTRLGKCPIQNFFRPNGYDVLLIDNKFYLRKQNKIIAEILAINNKKIREVLQEKISATAGSTKQYIERQAVKNIFISRDDNPFDLKLKIDNQIIDKKINCRSFVYKPPKERVFLKFFENHIGYIKIPAWSENVSENILENKIKYLARKKIKALIVDVRGNSGGNSNIARSFASHFFNEKTLFSITKKRVSKDNFKLEETQAFVFPQKPFLDISIIVLADALCLVQTNTLSQG